MKTEVFTSVNVSEGDFELRLGTTLTSLYFKGQEKFVFKTAELPVIVALINEGLKQHKPTTQNTSYDLSTL